MIHQSGFDTGPKCSKTCRTGKGPGIAPRQSRMENSPSILTIHVWWAYLFRTSLRSTTCTPSVGRSGNHFRQSLRDLESPVWPDVTSRVKTGRLSRVTMKSLSSGCHDPISCAHIIALLCASQLKKQSRTPRNRGLPGLPCDVHDSVVLRQPGGRSQEPGVRSQKSGVRSQGSGVRGGFRDGEWGTGKGVRRKA